MTDACAKCGYPRKEHSYNGACYGLCGEFAVTSTPSLPAQIDDIAAVKRIIARLELVDGGFGVCVLHRVLVTLQQHERLVTEIAEMEAGYKNAAELVLTYHGKNERLEAALRLIAAFEGKTLITASDDPHERQAYSLGAHRAFAQASGVASDALAALDAASPLTTPTPDQGTLSG